MLIFSSNNLVLVWTKIKMQTKLMLQFDLIIVVLLLKFIIYWNIILRNEQEASLFYAWTIYLHLNSYMIEIHKILLFDLLIIFMLAQIGLWTTKK